MPSRSGLPSHIDISVSNPGVAIPFYAALLEALGYHRWQLSAPEWRGDHPRRASWTVEVERGVHFGIEVRPSRGEERTRRYDRYAPGPHHIAFRAEDRETVDRCHRAVVEVDGDVLDAPTDYGGQPGYGEDYYAVFFADPDGVKLEVVCMPAFGR